ncbi:MAG TPA: tape measure protein [Trichocoleus sp.]|jgi:tape measure domain-containing protein
MPTAGTLDLVLSANSSQLRQELGKVRQESQTTALAITNLFSGDTINAAGFRIVRGTIVGLIGDIDEMNNGLSVSESLTRNLTNSFQDLGDIALLQLGQIAQFLGNDLFENPILAGFQSEALNKTGLSQLEGAFQILTAGMNAAKLAQPILKGIEAGFESIDSVLDQFAANINLVGDFFRSIAKNAQFAGNILQTVVELIDNSIDALLETLAQLSPEFAQVRKAAKDMGIEFKMGQSWLGEYIADLQKIEDAATAAASGADRIAGAAEEAGQSIRQAGEAVSEFDDKLERQLSAAESAKRAIEGLAEAAQLFSIWQDASEIVDGFFGDLEQNFNAAKSAQTLNNQLQVVSKSAGGAREDLAYLSKTTNDLGLNFDATAAGFVQFSTAASMANLTASETKDIFAGVSQSASVMGLNAADTQGVFLALQQILSSGNVQLEELNQIAERVPGTFQAAAAALGVTTSELKGLISTGTVDSKSFLAGFAQQLKVFTESGVVKAMNSAEAATNRFENALGNLQIAMGKTWVEVGTPALNTFAAALQFAADNEELLSTSIDAILVAAVGRAAFAAYDAAAAFFKSAENIKLFQSQLASTVKTVGVFAAQIALAYVATLVFYRIVDRIKDGATDARASIQSLDKSIADLAEAAGNAPDLNKLVPAKPPAADWVDVIIEQINKVRKEYDNLPAPIKAMLGLASGGIGAVGNAVGSLIPKLSTNGEKQANDQLAALQDFSDRVQGITQKSAEFRVDPNNAINGLKQIDAQLKQIEQRKLGLDPKDAKAVAAIRAEENALLADRSKAQKEVLAYQSALNNSLAQAKQNLQNLDPGKLGMDTYKSLKAGYENQIAAIEQEKTALDGLANKAVTTNETIATSYKKSNQEIESSYSDKQIQITEALAKGQITEEQARQQSLDAEQAYLQQKLKLNQDSIAKIKTELERNAKLKAIDPNSATLSADQEKELQTQLQQLELETAQTRIKSAQNVTTAKQQANDQQISDLQKANQEAEAATQRSENARIQAIKQRQLEGKISEEEAAKQIAAVQQSSTNQEITQQQSRLKQVQQLLQQGVISKEDAAQQESEIQDKLSQLNLQKIDEELQAQKDANQDKIKDFEQSAEAQKNAITSAQNDRIIAVKAAQAAGVLGEKEAAEQIAAIQRETIGSQIEQKQQEIAGVKQLRAQGVLDEEEANKRLATLGADLQQLKIQQIDAEVAARKQALNDIENATKEAETAIANSQNTRIAAVKQAQLSGVLGEKEAAQQIEQIQLESANQTIAAKQNELAQIRDARAAGTISAQEAADKEKALIQELGQLNLDRLDKEIQAQQTARDAAVKAIEDQYSALESKIKTTSELLDLQKNSYQSQSDLLTAQSDLQESLNTLAAERLNTQIAIAEASGNQNEVERLKQQSLDLQGNQLEQQLETQRQQLDLQEKIKAIELEKEQIQSRINVLEAEAALKQAEARNASAQEISALQQVLDLRKQQVEAVNQSIAQQDQLNQLARQNLAAQQQISREKQAQQQVEAEAQRQQARSTSSSSSSSSSDKPASNEQVTTDPNHSGVEYHNYSTTGFQGADYDGPADRDYSPDRDKPLRSAADHTTQLDRLKAQYANFDPRSQYIGADGRVMSYRINASGISDLSRSSKSPSLNLKSPMSDIQAGGQSQQSSQAISTIAAGNKDLSSKLDILTAVFKQGLNRPNIYVGSAEDMQAATKAHNDISKNQLRSRGW